MKEFCLFIKISVYTLVFMVLFYSFFIGVFALSEAFIY